MMRSRVAASCCFWSRSEVVKLIYLVTIPLPSYNQNDEPVETDLAGFSYSVLCRDSYGRHFLSRSHRAVARAARSRAESRRRLANGFRTLLAQGRREPSRLEWHERYRAAARSGRGWHFRIPRREDNLPHSAGRSREVERATHRWGDSIEVRRRSRARPYPVRRVHHVRHPSG